MTTARAAKLAPYLFVALATLAPEAWAYLDPSTGSMILSAIVGLFATAALAIKTFWYRLKGLFRGGNVERHERAPDEDGKSPDSRPSAD